MATGGSKLNWLKKLDIFFGKGIQNAVPEFIKTLVLIRFWLSIAGIAFIVFLFGFLAILYKIFIN